MKTDEQTPYLVGANALHDAVKWLFGLDVSEDDVRAEFEAALDEARERPEGT